MATPGLGRRQEPEPAMAEYPLRRLMAPVPTPAAPVFWLPDGPPLNQGQTGECVGYGMKLWLICPPLPDKRTAKPSALAIYKGACKDDEFPDNDNGDPQAGTSVRGALKWMLAQKRIGAYHWSTSAKDVDDYLATTGPVVIGVNWYDSMFDVDASGFLRIPPSAKIAGGHCVCLIGRDPQKGVMGQCAWGTQFGIKDAGGKGTSRFWLAYDVLDRLLGEEGEACAAAEVGTRRPGA